MTFWKNPRYREFETTVAEGDPLRGCPRRELPWEVAALEFRDAKGDLWNATMTCVEIEPEIAGPFVATCLEARFTCTPSDERLRELGLSPNRIHWAANGRLTILPLDRRIRFREKIDGIEKVGRAWLEKNARPLVEGFTDADKAQAIHAWMQNLRFSRFSGEDEEPV